MKKVVLDTNILLEDPKVVHSFPSKKVIVSIYVIEELDKLKTRNDNIGFNARTALKMIEEICDTEKLELVTKKFVHYDLDQWSQDNKILSCALDIMTAGEDVVLVSNDLNMRLKAKAMKIPTSDFKTTAIAENGLYKGFRKIVVDDVEIDNFYSGYGCYIPSGVDLNANEYIVLESNLNFKRKALGRFVSHFSPLKKVNTADDVNLWTIKPRNSEQFFAADALLDDSIPVVSLIGVAGSGKTLMATAAGVQQVFGKRGSDKLYKKLIIARPIQTLGNDIGFLPGSMEEKLAPWIQPVMDNLEVLTGGNTSMVEEWFNKGKIEVEALAYIRGRSINDCFIIIDEAQNLTAHEVKTILTRVGHGTKIVLTGDIEQIDNAKISELTNGLTYCVERLKNRDIMAHITLTKSERSKVAEICAKEL